VTIRGNYVSNRPRRHRFSVPMRNASSRIWNWVNKKLTRLAIGEFAPRSCGAIYRLLKCVEINFKKLRQLGEITCRIGADVTFSASQCEMRQVESETELIKKLTRILILEIAWGTRGAIYVLLNCVEINFKKLRQLGEITCRIGADVTFSASQCEMRQVESESELIKNWRN